MNQAASKSSSGGPRPGLPASSILHGPRHPSLQEEPLDRQAGSPDLLASPSLTLFTCERANAAQPETRLESRPGLCAFEEGGLLMPSPGNSSPICLQQDTPAILKRPPPVYRKVRKRARAGGKPSGQPPGQGAGKARQQTIPGGSSRQVRLAGCGGGAR